MASPAQIAANRAHAQHSTGPRTEQGKRRIASNALKHILVQQLATLQTHYLALIDNQAEDMDLDLKEKFVVDPDTDSRYAMAFEKQTKSRKKCPNQPNGRTTRPPMSTSRWKNSTAPSSKP